MWHLGWEEVIIELLESEQQKKPSGLQRFEPFLLPRHFENKSPNL